MSDASTANPGLSFLDVQQLTEALRLCLEALHHHDQWCGFRLGAPGHSSFNRAREAAQAALSGSPFRQELLEEIGWLLACNDSHPTPIDEASLREQLLRDGYEHRIVEIMAAAPRLLRACLGPATRSPHSPETWQGKRLRELAQALVTALDACLPHIDAMATLQHVHGFGYKGPTFGVELQALREQLAAAGSPPSPPQCIQIAAASADSLAAVAIAYRAGHIDVAQVLRVIDAETERLLALRAVLGGSPPSPPEDHPRYMEADALIADITTLCNHGRDEEAKELLLRHMDFGHELITMVRDRALNGLIGSAQVQREMLLELAAMAAGILDDTPSPPAPPSPETENK